MHPTLKVIAKFPDPIDASKSHVPLFAITEFMPDIRIGGSNFTPGIFGMSVAEDWENRKELMKKQKYCGIYYAMIRGTGNGRIRVIPFSQEPFVSYELSRTDWKNMALGTKYLAEVMFAAGAEQVFPSIESHQSWRNMDEVNKETKNHNLPKTKIYLSTVHLFGSCPLGENKNPPNPLCVTDSYGKLHGYENIFVADASIIPEAPGVNPQATVMGLAYRVADAFLSSY
jgi:choline dehydrogenase-like flavoprotein